MKQHLHEKHGEPKQSKIRGGQTNEFQAFKDEQFFANKKTQSQPASSDHKFIGSLNVFAITRLKQQSYPNISHGLIFPKQHKNSIKQSKNMRNIQFNSVGCSQQIQKDKANTQSQQKLSRVSRLQRYNRSSNSQVKVMGEMLTEQYSSKTNNQKIGILKKIIQHYNIKSVQRSYQSNLMSKLNNTSSQSCKNRFVTVKKIVPKSAVRREIYNVNRNQIAKIKFKCGDMHGFDLLDSYFNHNKILVEATSINELIKGANEVRVKTGKSITGYQCKSKCEKKAGVPSSLYRKTGHKYETLPTEKLKHFETTSDNCINVKVNKFKQFLFMINFANKVYRQLDITKYESSFKIFIGSGNNSNLIKAIMKRRFWFQIVKNREEANFIWTQLKEESAYEKQRILYQMKKQKRVASEEISNEAVVEDVKTNRQGQSIVGTSYSINDDTYQQQQCLSLKNSPQKFVQLQIRDRKQLKGRKIKQRNQSIYQPESRILTKQQLQAQKQLICQMFSRKRSTFSTFNDRVRYLRGFNTIQLQQLKQQLIHNHLPVNGLLGNKKAMFYMLRQYYKLTNRSVFTFIPLTFHIKRGFLDDQFKQFMNKFVHNRSNKLPNYWIIKPGQFSNRGQGISCSNKLEQIRARVGSLRTINKNKSLILQQYITNPLLYNGRKFDIRTYMLLTVNNGRLRGYWYQDGYIRTSSFIWSLEQIGDSYIHLTNDAIQKYSSNYGKYQPGNKLTYSELQRYLDSLPKSSNKSYNFQSEIYPRLKEIAADAIRSCFCFIDPDRMGNNFQIFGFDFMIDTDFKPWLIQINTNPCLEMSCPVLDRIIPSMVQNALRIGLDPIIPPPLNYSSTFKYSIPENALHYNKFEIIFDEDRDGRQLVQLYQGNDIVKCMDEYEEDKQIYEEEGQEITLQEP